eukprot:768429-Hanusia_phi.AAC.1
MGKGGLKGTVKPPDEMIIKSHPYPLMKTDPHPYHHQSNGCSKRMYGKANLPPSSPPPAYSLTSGTPPALVQKQLPLRLPTPTPIITNPTLLIIANPTLLN